MRWLILIFLMLSVTLMPAYEASEAELTRLDDIIASLENQLSEQKVELTKSKSLTTELKLEMEMLWNSYLRLEESLLELEQEADNVERFSENLSDAYEKEINTRNWIIAGTSAAAFIAIGTAIILVVRSTSP